MTNIDLSNREARYKHFGSVDPIKGTKPKNKEDMADLQNTKKDFLFDVQSVGINNLTYPVKVGDYQSVGNFELATSLRRDEKGINMSRILESLQTQNDGGIKLEFDTLEKVLEVLKERMEQESSELTVESTWFFNKPSPGTKLDAVAHADVLYHMEYNDNKVTKTQFGMTANVTTLCPCSKEISEYSAHNQRGYVKVLLDIDENKEVPENYKEIVYRALEINASSQLYPILKRTDEKMVTERAYENPRFVEDLIRLVAYDIHDLPWVKAFEVECRNEESIHQHDAFSRMRFEK